MAKDAQRVFIIVIVAVFLVSTLAFTGIVIWSITRDNSVATTEFEEFNETNVPNEEGPVLTGTQYTEFEPTDEPVTELQIIDLEEGTGPEVPAGATVTAHYTGALVRTGIIFDTSFDRGEPTTFPLDGVIQGWQEGVPGMKEGGVRRLIIPADLAYGEGGSPPSIGPNEPLMFDIELVSVQQ